MKGEAVLHCLAMQEDDAVRVLNSSTPFTQILELPEAEEDALTAVRMTVSEADCRLESDGMLSCTISAQAIVLLRQERRLRCIEDMYLPARSLLRRQSILYCRICHPRSRLPPKAVRLCRPHSMYLM